MTSKLISCLSALSKEEWISFRKFLLMKTGQDSDNYILFKSLQKRKLKLADMNNTDKIWREEFSHMSQKVFANLQSRITNWLEEWIVFYDAQKNVHLQKVRLIESYNKRGLYQLAVQVYSKTLKQIDHDESAEHDHIIASLHKAQYYSDNPIKHAKGAKLLEDVVHTFVQWHSKQSSLYLAELHNWGDIQHVEFSEEKELINQTIITEKLSPAFTSMVKLVSEKEPKYLLKLIEEIESGKIKAGTLTYIIFINYCLTYLLRLTNQGKMNDPELLLKLYTLGMNTGSFFSNGKIPMMRFHNIVNAISTCVTKNECDQFIQQWSDQVSSKDLIGSKKIALAVSSLNYQAYHEIIPLLIGLKHEDISEKLMAGSLLTLAFYEEGDQYYDTLLNHIFNYKRQIKRNRTSISHKLFHAYLNLCDFIEKIVSQNKSLIKDMELSDYPYIMYRSWAKRKLQILQE